MPITLVHAGLSPFGIKCKLVLLEKGIPYTVEPPLPEKVAGHPRREVPLLIDGDVSVWDSRIICEYLEDKFPTPSVMPHDPALRVRARMAAEVVDTHLEAINWGLHENAIDDTFYLYSRLSAVSLESSLGSNVPDLLTAHFESK
ncbi:hypothetical protein HDU93_003688 [Gonapodya sp. JEL0774]|nr:hypothetical protein HDU93_003688 [Gonapodya sp. JEL0774]